MKAASIFGVLVAGGVGACGLDSSRPQNGEGLNSGAVSIVKPISVYVDLNEIHDMLGEIETDGFVAASEWSLQLDFG